MADRKDGMAHINVRLFQGLAGLMANWSEETRRRLLEAMRADGRWASAWWSRGWSVEEVNILEEDSKKACEEHALELGFCAHGDAMSCDMC